MDGDPVSDNTEKKQRNLHPYKPGQSGNPAGRPKGARSRLAEKFVDDVLGDWQEHGVAVIQSVRKERPADYLKVVASILPKDLNIGGEIGISAAIDSLIDRRTMGRVTKTE